MQNAGACFGQPLGNGDHLGVGCPDGGGQVAIGGAVNHGAGGRKAQGPGLYGLTGQGLHLGDLFGGGVFAVRAALAHHIDPQGPVRCLGSDIDIVGQGVNGVHIVAKALPVPR